MNTLHHHLTTVRVRALARLSALLTLALALPASAEIIGVDQFDYPDGAIAGKNGGTFWDYKNTSPTGHTNVKSNWDYIGFGGPADISGGKLVTNTHGWAKREYNGANESDGAVNETNVAKTVYARVTVTTGATLPSYFGFASYDFGNERLFVGKRNGGNAFGYEIIGGASASSAFTAPVNSTFTLVLRLDFEFDRIQLYLDPVFGLPLNHQANLDARVVDTDYTNSHWSTALRLASGAGSDPISWDDFVVATTWEDLTTVVTTLNDEDDGSLGGGAGVSLREAVKYSPVELITFDPSFSGKMIRLTLGEMEITRQVNIDASNLTKGVIIDANEKSGHFVINSGKSLTATGLTLGWGAGFGGSILNNGLLKLTRCTLMENLGGALLQTTISAESILDHCTVTGNSATGTGSTTGGAEYFQWSLHPDALHHQWESGLGRRRRPLHRG